VIATEGFHTFYDAQASALATAAGRRRQRRRRAHEKNQRKCVMSGVEGALSTRTPRPRWPRRPPGRRAAARRRRRAAAGRRRRATAGRPPPHGDRRAAAGRHRRAATGRHRKGGRRPPQGGRWPRVGDENSMFAAESQDRGSAPSLGNLKTGIQPQASARPVH